MKNLVIIIHSDVQLALADQLRGLGQVEDFTFAHVEGHFAQAEDDAALSARDKVVGYTPRVRVDILLEDADVLDVLEAIQRNAHGVAGHGMFWVADVSQHGAL
jgi:nitrogen regulatory protein P-II 1